MLIPKRAFLTTGCGVHREHLVAFELALREAGIAAQNLVPVSSIIPPDCPIIPRAEGEPQLRPGQILHVVMSRGETNEPGHRIGASIGLALPNDASHHGFIAEYAARDLDEAALSVHSADLAATMLGTILGVELDASASWEERAELLRRSGKVMKTDAISRVAHSAEDGRWTCVVACCVLITD